MSAIADVINNIRHRGCAAQPLAQSSATTSNHEAELNASLSPAVAGTAGGGSTGPSLMAASHEIRGTSCGGGGGISLQAL